MILEPEQIPNAIIDLMIPRTYTKVLGIQRGSGIFRDNFGYSYYINKKTETKM